MPRILDDLNEDPEFQALSPAAKTAVMQAAKRKPLVTMDAADPAPPKRTRSVVEREPAPDPLDAYLPKKPPVPKAVSARFKRAKEQDSVDQLAEDTRSRRIGMTGPALTAERLRENLAGAALQGAKDMGNPVQLGAEVLGAALARPALDAIAEDDERRRPAIERAADRSPAARRIQPNYFPAKSAWEQADDFIKPIEDAAKQIAADPADALDPTRPGTAEGQVAYIGATGVNLVDPIGDAAVNLALKGAGKLVRGAANLADPRSRTASRIADAARAAERTGADLGDVGRVDPATQSGVLMDDGTPQKSWPERLDNLGQQMARRARGGVMKRGVTADNAESVIAERTRMMDEANRMQDTARSMMGNPAQLADMRPLPRDGYRPVGEDPPPPAAAPPSTMVDQPPTPAPNPAGGSSLDDLEAAYQRATQEANRALETLPAGHPDLARLSDAERVARDAFNRAKAGRFAAQAAPAPAAAPAPRGAEPWQMPRAEFEATGEDLMHGTSSRFDRFDRQSANRYGAKGRNEAGRFYFTDKPEVADTFAGATGYKQVDVNHFAEAEGLDAKEAMPGLLASLREQIAKGRRLVMPDPDTGSMIDVTPDDPRLAEYLLDEGDVRLYAPNRGPNVIKAKVYGKTLDLTDRAKLPPDLVAELKAEGRYDPTARMPDFQHEYSKVLYDWARRNGYGKIRVGDTYESGFKSTIGLEEFIGYGRDPHREAVEQALREGRPVPAEVMADYPDLAPTQETGGGPFLRRLASEERGEFDINKLVPQPKRAGTSAGMSDPKDQPAIDADLSRMFSEQAPSDGIERMARDAAAGNRDAMRALEAERTRLVYEMDMPAPGSPELGAAMRAYIKFEREVFDPAQESFWNVPNDKKTTYGADPVAEMGGAGSQTAAARTRETEGLLTVARWDRDNIEERIDGFWAEQREQDGYEGITRDRDGTLAELRRNREFRDLEAQQQEIAAYMRSLEADLAGPAGPSTPEPAGAFDLPPDTGPSFGGLVRGEDGAFRPGAIGDTLRRLFGRDKAPIPAPQAAIAPRVSEATPMRAGEGLTFDGRPVSRATVPLDEINLDPQTYQFKASDAVTGRNARFDGEDTWRADNLTQKPIMVHRRADGRLYVADGHQRVNLARSLRAQGQVIPPLNAIIMDEADGWTPDLVMRKASLMNLDEGTGNALDVARLIAKGGMTPEQVAGLAKSSAAVRDGRTLSTLDDEALTFVANQDIKPSVAAAAAQATDDPAMRMVILREIADDRPATAGEAALLARDVIETGISQGRPADQLAMFDLSQYSKSNRKTLYKIVNTLKTALKGDESLGRLLTARADEIKRVEGNALNDEANNLLKTEAGALQYMLEREAGAVGPFRDALKALAAEVDRGQITVSGAAARARQALADAGPQELRQPDGAVRVGGVEERPDPRPVQAQGPLPDTDLFGNPVGAPEPAAVAPATAEPFTPPAPTPEAGGPVVAPERSALERMAAALERTQQQRAAAVQARNGAAVLALDRRITLLQEQIAAQAPAPTGRLSEVDQLALEQATRMRDRFARAGNERGVTEFQAQIDAIEARRQAAPAEAPTGPEQSPPAPTARQTQGRINNLRMRQRKALDAGNQEEAGRLGAEIQLIEDATSPEADRAMRSDPNSVAASRYQNFRKFGGSDGESRVFAEMVRKSVAESPIDPKTTVTFDDIRSEAAALDPALLDKISRKGLQPGETLHPAVRQAMRDRVKGISREIADLEERINQGLAHQNVAEAGELEAMAAQLRRDAQSYIDVLIPARSQDGRNLAFHRMTAASSFAPEYWISKARRIVNGNTARPLPDAVEQQMTSTLARGERAQTELERVVERLKARGIDTSFVDNPTIRIPPAVEDDGVVSKFFNQVRRLFKKEDGHWDQAAFDRWVAGAVQALKPQARKGAITFPGRVPGGRPRARYEGPPMTGDPDIDQDLRHAWNLTQEVHGTRIAVAQQLTDLEKTTYLEAIALFRKAGLLTGVKTIQRNIFGTWAAVGLEEVVRWPASAIDALLSAAKLTEEAGQRTTFRPRAAEIAASLSAAKTRGWQEFKEVMAHGMTAEDLAKIDHHREMNTGIKPLDTYVNTVMRFQSAQDRLGKAYAYSRSIQDQARALSKGDEAVRRELMAKPTDDMAREAVADAEFATFTNDTLLGQKLVQLTRGNKPGDAWSFIMDNIIPFKKTPAAVATRVIDYTPMGTVFRLGQVLGERLDSGLKVPVFTENGVERQVVRESRLTAKLNRREQQIVSGALARGGVGTALIAMGALLAANARMNGNYDPRRREEDEAAGRQPGTMRVFGHWVPVGALSPIGNLLALGASLYESPSALGMLSGALGTVLDQPMTQGAQQIVKLTNPSEQGLARDASRLIASQAASYLPTIGAEFAQALDTREDGYARVPEIDTTSTMAAIGDSMRARVPFLRSGLPGKVDSLGNPVRVPGGVSAFGAFAGRPAAEVNDAVIQAVIGLGVELRPVNDSIIDYGVKGRADDVSVKLTPQMEADYRTMRGAAIRDAIGKAIESDEFRAAAASGMQDRMRDVVQAAVGAGQKAATKAFRAQHADGIKAGRPEAMEKKNETLRQRARPTAGDAPWWDEPGATVPPALRGRTATPTSP